MLIIIKRAVEKYIETLTHHQSPCWTRS